MAVKRQTVKPSTNPQNSIWTTENELKLFKAALKFKPAGVIRHFNMALIHNELVNGGMKDVTPAMIWEHLGLLYNLEAADKIEKRAPLNLESSEAEFSLPKKDFYDLMNDPKKLDNSSEDPKEEVVVKKPNPAEYYVKCHKITGLLLYFYPPGPLSLKICEKEIII